MIEKTSLNALKFFYFVVMHNSVTKAAQKLFVTQSAVSKQIKNLEDTLGKALFIRVNKTLVLTTDGRRLFECCEQIFPRLEHCLTELTAQTDSHHKSKQLVLSCEPTLSMKWLIPRLAEFNRLNLGFEIVLLTAGGQVDFADKAIDIALRRNDFDWGDGVYHEKIADEYVALVRRPRSGRDNTSLPNTLLLSSSRPHLWQHLLTLNTLSQEVLTYEISYLEHFYLCIEAALAGLGVAVVSSYMVEKELANEALEMVQPPMQDGSAYHLLSATPFAADARKLAFKAWLAEEMLKSEDGFKVA